MTRLLPMLAFVFAAAAVTVVIGFWLSGNSAIPSSAAAFAGIVLMALAVLVRLWGRKP